MLVLVFLKVKNMLCSSLKDAELLQLVPAASCGYQHCNRHSKPPGATAAGVDLGCRCWSQLPAARAVPRPPPRSSPVRPQPIIRIIGHESTRFQPLCRQHSVSGILDVSFVPHWQNDCGDLQREGWGRVHQAASQKDTIIAIIGKVSPSPIITCALASVP
jgi:hypothetical protein